MSQSLRRRRERLHSLEGRLFPVPLETTSTSVLASSTLGARCGAIKEFLSLLLFSRFAAVACFICSKQNSKTLNMPKSPRLYGSRKLTCSSFPAAFLEKVGWDSCVNCALDRSVPDRLRKIDPRRCLRAREGKLINVNICCNADNDSSDLGPVVPAQATPIGVQSEDKENSGRRRDYRMQSKTWWDNHNKSIDRLKMENSEYKEDVKNLKEANAKLQEENSHLKQELVSTRMKLLKASEAKEAYEKILPTIHKESRRPEMLAMIGATIIVIFNVIMKKTQQITRLRAICEVLFEKELFGAVPTERVLKNYSKMYSRRYLFLPWKVLQSLDMSINGGINYNGLEALRKVEGLRDYERGCLPSRAVVQRCAAELHEKVGQELVPVEKVESELGEMFQFHYEKLVRHILRAFQLDEIAQRESVELCITLDGAELTKDLCHLTFGIKVTDPRAIDPRDGCPLSYSEDGVFGNLFRVQSRNYCFIMKSLLGKDSKRAYAEFSDVFKFFDDVMKNGLPANENGPRIMPIIIWSPQDLSSIWKCLNTGSGARKHGTTHWCHLCPCTGNKIGSFSVGLNRFVCIAKFVVIIKFLITFMS